MRNKIFMIISFLAAVLIVTSCLKDKVGEDWTSSLKGKMYAQIPNNGAQTFTIAPIATDQVFKFLVNIATDAVPTSDITANFTVDNAAMIAYTAQVQAADTSIHWSYELYPSFTILDNPVTIKAGTRNAYVHVKVSRADTIRLTSKYMIPLTMSNVSSGVTVAANMQTVLWQLPIANKWEGTYKMKGYILRDPFPDYTGWYKNRTMKLATAGPSTVQITNLWYWAAPNASSSVGGIGNWLITISEASVPNPISLVDPDNAAVKLLSTYPNRYDPATKTIYMSVYWGTGPTNRATTDTLTYYGPY
jgi:hypothetical protein